MSPVPEPPPAVEAPCDLSAHLWSLCGPADGNFVHLLDPKAQRMVWEGQTGPDGAFCARGVPPGVYQFGVSYLAGSQCGVDVTFDRIRIPAPPDALPVREPLPGAPLRGGDDTELALRLDQQMRGVFERSPMFPDCADKDAGAIGPGDANWSVTVLHLTGLSRDPEVWTVTQGTLCSPTAERPGQRRVMTQRFHSTWTLSTATVSVQAWTDLAQEIAASGFLLGPPRPEIEPPGDELWVVFVHGRKPGFLYLRYLQDSELAPWMRGLVDEGVLP